MVIHECNKEKEINELLRMSSVNQTKIESMHETLDSIKKALMGNGTQGYFAEFNQFKGGMKLMKFVLGSTVLTTLGLVVKAFI